jgi:hypothetical protein
MAGEDCNTQKQLCHLCEVHNGGGGGEGNRPVLKIDILSLMHLYMDETSLYTSRIA